MPVRVRTRIRGLKGSKVGEFVEASSLLNTGYAGSSPEIIVPLKLAERLGFWPPIKEVVESTYETAGGPVRFFVVREAAVMQVIEEDAASKELVVDVVISPMEREVLLCDFVIGELEMVILNAYRGHWRFGSDEAGKIRQSQRPELW